MSGARAKLVMVGTAIILALAVVVVRLLLEERTAYRQGQAAEALGESREAIRHYLDAGRAYLPGSPIVRQALDRLDAIAVSAIRKSDYATARSACEAERAALLGARSFYIPSADRLPVIDRRLARLLAASEDPAGSASFAARAAWHEQRLEQRSWPRPRMVLLALGGLALWITSTVAFVRGGLDKNLALVRAPALLAGIGFLVGLALFVICLRLA
jgi:type II secretory pathway pseudopilin PulG